MEDGDCFHECEGNVRATIGTMNDRGGGRGRGFKSNSIITNKVEDRAINDDVASPISGRRRE